MKITIEVPEMTCAKCCTTAPIQPVFLYAKGAVPPQFREALTTIVKERADVHATDDGGRTWEAFADDKPVGWAKGPAQSDLCATCAAEWTAAGKAFLTSSELPAKLEAAPLPPPPAKEQGNRQPTMSQILATRQYENSTPTNNSLMPLTAATAPRR